jgi:hypothetical protein
MSQPNCNVSFLPFVEPGIFTGQLGRYSGGSSYDRSIYNELFNGDGTFSRVLSYFVYCFINVILISTNHHYDKFDIESRKPEIIIDYNQYKGSMLLN